MTEDEYITLSNLQGLRIVLDILDRHLHADGTVIAMEDRRRLIAVVAGWIEQLEAKVQEEEVE